MTDQSTADEPRRPTLAVWKFSSCDGCQLTLLNCEDELLAVAGAVEIAYFPEATRAVVEGPYDLSLVEGSITTPEDVERIQEVRRVSRRLVTIGACATSGGIQALRDFADVEEFTSVVYAQPSFIEHPRDLDADRGPRRGRLPAARLPDRPGASCSRCSSAFLQDRPARIPAYSVCVECKRHGNVCVTVAHGTPCLGPVTHAGCGALCPSFARGCYGCFGAKGTPNTASMADRLRRARDVAARRGPGVPHLHRGSRAVPQRGREAPHEHPGRGGGQDVTHQTDDGGRLLKVDTLARVEGEGAMHVVVHGGAGGRRAAEDLRAAPVLRGVPARAGLDRAAGHHGAHLRHLPRRLPDERLPRARGRLRGRGHRRDPAAAPAAVLRRVDREPRAAHLPAARAGLPRLRRRDRDGPGPPRPSSSRACG